MRFATALILSTLCFAMQSCSNTTRDQASEKVTITSGKVDIAYIDTGKGDTTLLFMHGWCINKGYWLSQIKHFAGRYRVVAIDLPGFGHSGKNRNDWSTTAYGQDIKAVIEQLNLKHVILIGHSMAGDIVLEAAIDEPNKVMAIVGIDNFKSAGVPATGDTLAQRKAYNDAINQLQTHFTKMATAWFEQDLFYKTTPDSIKKRILYDVTHSDSSIAVATQRQGDYNEGDKLKVYNKKLYLINSDYQPTETSGLVAKRIPFKLYQVHATGHFPMVEKPGEFNSQLEKVIADLKRR